MALDAAPDSGSVSTPAPSDSVGAGFVASTGEDLSGGFLDDTPVSGGDGYAEVVAHASELIGDPLDDEGPSPFDDLASGEEGGEAVDIPGGAVAPTPPPSPAPVQQPADFTQEDFEYAARFGYTPKQIREHFGEPNAWRTWVNVQAAQMRAREQQARQRPQAPAPYQPQAYKFEGNEADYDPNVLAMNRHYANEVNRVHWESQQRVEALRQQFESHVPAIMEMRAEAARQKLAAETAAFDAIMDQYDEQVVGRGGFDSLAPAQRQARVELHETAEALWQTAARASQKNGTPMPPKKAVFDAAFARAGGAAPA